MPRKRPTQRASADTGAPAAAYNDGNNPVTVPTGLPYGQHQATEQSLAAVPAAGPQVGTAPPSGPTPGPPPDGALLDAARAYPMAGGSLFAPTARPGEPVTAGLPTGPGAGPEALGMDPTMQDAQLWRPQLPALEYLASQPNASQSTRNFVRRLRSIMPPNLTG